MREFSAGDLVLRKAVGSMRDTNAGKLAQTWEGPYIVTAIAGVEAYYLENMDEISLPDHGMFIISISFINDRPCMGKCILY